MTKDYNTGHTHLRKPKLKNEWNIYKPRNSYQKCELSINLLKDNLISNQRIMHLNHNEIPFHISKIGQDEMSDNSKNCQDMVQMKCKLKTI